jgi:ATP-dependent RNA helicase SUPV3L1/SUV3
VFEAVRKYDGEKERLLSDSQMKQIAGRAGRYGLLSENASGLVTTLHAADLAIVKSALTAPPVPLEHARFQYGLGLMNSLAEALPPGASMDTIDDAVMYVGRFGFVYRPTVLRRLPQMNQFFDQECPGLRLQERFFFMQAPIPWRDLDCLPVVARLLRLYRTRMSADIVETLEPSGLLKRLESAERTMADPADAPESTPKKLCLLESLHRILTLYMWLSYRNPVVWADHEVCMDLKARVEKALDWGLQGVAWSRRKSTSFKPKADNGLRYVSPFEAKKLRELSRRQPQAMYAS